MKGKILTYTELWVVPEGYDSPLGLCLVDTKEKGKLLAYSHSSEKIRIGQRVTLEKRGEHYYAVRKKLAGLI